jgi:hypothetical protein
MNIDRRRRWILTGCTVIAGISSARAEAAPCIDTNPATRLLTRTMRVQLPDRPEIAIVGAIAAIDGTGAVTIRLPTGEQTVRPTVIAIDVPPPNMMAQMALPLKEDLGPAHTRIALQDVSVKEGVVSYPQCMAPKPDHEVAFVGTLRIETGFLAVDGNFFDYRPAEPGPFKPGGAQKPGA